LCPGAIGGEEITATMIRIAATRALIIDLRSCLGGDPETVAWLCSYLYDREPVQLTSLDEPARDLVRQSWTLSYVPGRRFGPTKPVFVLTSHTTFSGGEQLSYDLQALGRATVVGERTRGGAHAREGFRVHPHLEATISVARAVSPITGANWEGVGVAPDIEISAEASFDRAIELAGIASRTATL
jgi:C-terminal processing protease CtpA/Prc